jgi:hypothetical protein
LKANAKANRRIGPCLARISAAGVEYPSRDPIIFGQETLDQLKTTSLDMWKFSEEELMYLLTYMFEEFGLYKEFNIDRIVMVNFLSTVREMYNNNPFHNFLHCFCVTQMVMFE